MKKRGYALPLSLCVAGVTLMLGLSAAQMTNGDLGVANHEYYQERARQAADFGLEYCVSHTVAPGTVLTVPSQSGAHPFDSVTVQMYNHGEAGSPMDVPEGFEYWVAEGRASERSGGVSLGSARVGALVRYGLSAGTSGALVRSFYVDSPDPVNFVAMDGLTNQTVLGESIAASEYNGTGSFFSFGRPSSGPAIDLGQVGAFGGKFRLPSGVNQNVVHFTSSTPVAIAQDGGPVNVPTFTPPAGLPALGGLALTNSFNGTLPSGHYQWLEVPADATVSLRGTYQFDELRLAPGVSTGQGGTLRVAAPYSAKVFVSDLQLGQGSLGLSNENGSAQNFRFTLKPVRGTANPPNLNFKLPGGGGVALVADGHPVTLQADASREIRGAFSAAALQVKFPSAGVPFAHNPTFIYDVSASTARRARTGGGPAGSGEVDNTSSLPSNGDTDNVSGYQGGSEGEVGSTNTTVQSGDLILERPAGVEPMILSRQTL